MFRTFALSFLGLAALTGLNAGQITVGGSTGLTGAYQASGCSGATAGQTGLAGYQGCVAGSITAAGTTSGTTFRLFGNQNLFRGDTENGVAPNFPTASLTSNDGTTFALINDGNVNDNNWAGSGGQNANGASATTTITFPIGIFDVDKAWTMLNDFYGLTGAQNTTVTFNFGATSNATATTAVNFNLVNGVEIRSATDCTGNSTSPAGPAPGTPTGGDFANGACTAYARTTSSANTSNAFDGLYNGNVASSQGVAITPYYYTAGNVNLDDQLFSFGNTYANQWLVSATITNTGGLATPQNPTSRTALSAITVDTLAGSSPTPEPSTVLLLMTGLGAIGIARFRRK